MRFTGLVAPRSKYRETSVCRLRTARPLTNRRCLWQRPASYSRVVAWAAARRKLPQIEDRSLYRNRVDPRRCSQPYFPCPSIRILHSIAEQGIGDTANVKAMKCEHTGLHPMVPRNADAVRHPALGRQQVSLKIHRCPAHPPANGSPCRRQRPCCS